MKNLIKKNAKKEKDEQQLNNMQDQKQQSNEFQKPRSPGMFITSDPKKLSELPSADQIVNRRPLSKSTISADYKPKLDGLVGKNLTLKRTSSTNITQRLDPKYTVTRTPSNMSLNLSQCLNLQPQSQLSNALTSSTDSKTNLTVNSKQSQTDLQRTSSLQTNLAKIPEIIEIASDREANIRNYEIEQFRSDENDLREQFNDLLTKMSTLQKTLDDLEGRELEEVQQKRQEAEHFERETRDKIEQIQVRKEEVDRESNRLDNRLKELKSLQRETQLSKNMNNKMRNEMGKCLRKLGKQYENGCRKYIKELQSMETEANDRRTRDRELMDQYKQKQNELAVLLEEKMILRKSLEERNQLEKLLGQNGISLLVSNQKDQINDHQDLSNEGLVN